MNYISLFSGIEAATQAFSPLGWNALAFSEIDKFPSAVLKHHYPDIPNLGDVTKYKEWPGYAVDLICGGSPCQDYSIAGLRLGMDGHRGQLTLTFVECLAWYRPTWFIWENVVGVLSSNRGRDFARLLGDLTGQKIGVPSGGWKNSGIIPGISDAYGVAYRVLDAQHVRTRRFPHAVPQRRRRVFVVGYLGDWRRAAAVLFDRESLSGHPAPRREAGQGTAASPSLRAQRNSSHRADSQAYIPTANSGDVSYCLTASAQGSLDAETETLVASPILAAMSKGGSRLPDQQGALIPMAFTAKDHGSDAAENVSPTLRSGGHADSHANAGVMPAVAFPAELSGTQYASVGDVSISLSAKHTAAVAFQDRTRGDDGRGYDRPPAASNDVVGTLETVKPWNVATPMAVRRLTPREAERLMGFPDDFTLVPYRGKPAADGPRYRALGNSWAVNVAEWIGERIDQVERWPS